MSKECGTKVTVDTTEADEQLDQLRVHASMVSKNVMMNVRKGYNSLVLMLDIMGETIPMAVNLAAQALFLAAEGFQTLAFAESMTVIGAAHAGLLFIMASMLFYRALTIQGEASVIENKLNSSIQLVNMWAG